MRHTTLTTLVELGGRQAASRARQPLHDSCWSFAGDLPLHNGSFSHILLENSGGSNEKISLSRNRSLARTLFTAAHTRGDTSGQRSAGQRVHTLRSNSQQSAKNNRVHATATLLATTTFILCPTHTTTTPNTSSSTSTPSPPTNRHHRVYHKHDQK
jgi:hypothetical protein